MPMIDTAEVVAARYGISREAQDAYALESQRRTAAAQQARRFDAEIAPISTRMAMIDKATGEARPRDITLAQDEGPRPDTTAEGLAGLKPVRGEGKTITAGNASQLSDGAAACVLMDARLAERRGLQPLGTFRGFAVAGCEPDEMGIGPVFAVPRLLSRNGLSVDDIDLWELNEAFAVQVIYCRDRLGIDPDKLNVDGGAIAVGHPYGMSGARLDRPRPHRGQAARREARRRDDVRRRRHGRRRPLRDRLRRAMDLRFTPTRTSPSATRCAPSSAKRCPSLCAARWSRGITASQGRARRLDAHPQRQGLGGAALARANGAAPAGARCSNTSSGTRCSRRRRRSRCPSASAWSGR